MNLNITGHHIEVTPAIREYVTGKLERVLRHFDQVTSSHVILSVEKLQQKAEVTPPSTRWPTSWIGRWSSTRKRFPTTTTTSVNKENRPANCKRSGSAAAPG